MYEKLLNFVDIKEVPFKSLCTHQHGYTGKTEEPEVSNIGVGSVSQHFTLLTIYTSCESAVPLLSKYT